MNDPAKPSPFPFFQTDRQVRPLCQAKDFPDPPPWRVFGSPDAAEAPPDENEQKGAGMILDQDVADAVNAALVLRRPLLVTGKPGTGKSSLAYAVAHQLKLGKVLVWPITSRSTLQQGLYAYDAVARLQAAALAYYQKAEEKPPPARGAAPKINRPPQDPEGADVGRYIRLGPLGTALLPGKWPRVLLIDEIDKSDVDLPNDLLHVFEEGSFPIPELARVPKKQRGAKAEVFPHDADEPVGSPGPGSAVPRSPSWC
jgi:MoxR-like ATPase